MSLICIFFIDKYNLVIQLFNPLPINIKAGVNVLYMRVELLIPMFSYPKHICAVDLFWCCHG